MPCVRQFANNQLTRVKADVTGVNPGQTGSGRVTFTELRANGRQSVTTVTDNPDDWTP